MKVSVAVLFALLLSAPSWAVLGQPEQSVTSDQQRMRGALRSTTGQGYTVHEIDAPDGMIVKEYVAPGGVVFGVSWRGPTMPDLQNLLGSYFPEFQCLPLGERRRIIGRWRCRTDRLVVEVVRASTRLPRTGLRH